MTDERTTTGRERDESLREVASAHAAALAGKGGFVPVKITEPLPDIDIDWRTDEVRYDAVVIQEHGGAKPVLAMRCPVRRCLGCLDVNDLIAHFQNMKVVGRKVPDGAIYRIQARHPGGPWVDLFWGRKGDEGH